MAEISYATDEDVALRASADFAILTPRDQKLAYGLDGSFDPSDRWTLRSSSVDFSAVGLVAGQVVQLLGPVQQFRPPGETLVVVGTTGTYVTLRRKGQARGVGQPPSPSSGLVAVEFLIATLSPQIARASFDLDRRFGISDLMPGHRSSDLVDPRELREAAVLTVLHRQYLAMSRDAGGTNQDVLAAKAEAVKAELDEQIGRLAVHWRTISGVVGDDPSTRFSSRISR
jgi:hypothetical protein